MLAAAIAALCSLLAGQVPAPEKAAPAPPRPSFAVLEFTASSGKAEIALVGAAERGADALAAVAGLGPDGRAVAAEPVLTPPSGAGPAGHIALKLGGSFDIGRLNLEYDYYVAPQFQLLLQGSLFFSA